MYQLYKIVPLTIQSNLFSEDLSIGNWYWNLITIVIALFVFRKKIAKKSNN